MLFNSLSSTSNGSSSGSGSTEGSIRATIQFSYFVCTYVIWKDKYDVINVSPFGSSGISSSFSSSSSSSSDVDTSRRCRIRTTEPFRTVGLSTTTTLKAVKKTLLTKFNKDQIKLLEQIFRFSYTFLTDHYRINSRISREILEIFFLIFFQFDLYAGQYLVLNRTQVNTKMFLKVHFDLYAGRLIREYTLLWIQDNFLFLLKLSKI